MNAIAEHRRIAAFAAQLPRSPLQRNGLHEADAEIIDLGDASERLLVAKTDAIVEEIDAGLYADPELIGWMAVTSNLSDLAAVGADPVGVLVSLTLPPALPEREVKRLAAGVAAACEAAHTFELGGDTNEGATLAVAASAIGFAPRSGVLTRRGARAGDALYLTGPAGLGSVLALERLEQTTVTVRFRPIARLAEGRLLRGRARCCIDTSDGVLHAADTLSRVNECRVVLDAPWERVLHPVALAAARARRLPPWLLLAGVHGEFELLFAVAAEREEATVAALAAAGAPPIRVGWIGEGEDVWIRSARGEVPLDTTAIRNASAIAGRDPRAYVAALLAIARRTEGGTP